MGEWGSNIAPSLQPVWGVSKTLLRRRIQPTIAFPLRSTSVETKVAEREGEEQPRRRPAFEVGLGHSEAGALPCKKPPFLTKSLRSPCEVCKRSLARPRCPRSHWHWVRLLHLELPRRLSVFLGFISARPALQRCNCGHLWSFAFVARARAWVWVCVCVGGWQPLC